MLLILLVLIVVIIMVRSYNRLQNRSQEVREKASNVQVAISKKLSLINQLIDVVKNYQEGEQFVQLKVAQDSSTAGLMHSYQQSGAVLASLQGMVDRFPNLKANEQYNNLVAGIRESELNVQAMREKYNSAVMTYNTNRNRIPTVFVARFIGFSEAPYLQFDLSGNQDVTSLKDFKTDDGERLHQLLSGAGKGIAGATKSLAGQAGKLLEKHGDTAPADPADADTLYFFLPPGGVPQGPASLAAIRGMLEAGTVPSDTRVAPLGSSDWKALDPEQPA